ncbi:MAG: hypothetical protein WCZ23_08575 [Rhodospirillaceae bacterium]
MDNSRDMRLRTLCRMLRHAQDEAQDLDLDDLIQRLEQVLDIALATLPEDTPRRLQ